MGQLHSHFERNSIDYEMPKLCTLVKLIGSNHQKHEGFLSLIEETINMRVQHSLKSDSSLDLTSEAMKNLTEGMSRLSMSRKRMNTLLKTVIILEARKGRNMLAQDRRLCLQTLMLLADFDISVGKELKEILGEAAKVTYSGHMESISTDELSYLSLCNTFLTDDISQLVVKIITEKFEQATQL
jgi:hypothetical protein